MNKNIITAGMLAAGVASLYAENVTGLTEVQRTKPWSVSGTMRGFYDSNPNIQSHGSADSSWGLAFIPSVDYVRPMENSLFTANLTYTAWWYESRPDHNWDQQLQATARYNHQFSEHSVLDAQDTFLYSDQPAVTQTGFAQTAFLKSDTSYLQNTLPITYQTKFSERFGIAAGYQNIYYNYFDSVSPTTPVPYSALLNRLDQLINLDLDYYLREHLVVLGGYQLGWSRYLSDDTIGGTVAQPITGEDRSNLSQYFYVGAQNAFSTKLKASLKIGAVYTDWYELDQSDWSPYVDGNVSYNYLPGSWVRGGLTVSHNATDVIAATANPDDITLDQDSLTLYLGVTHAITTRLMLNLLGQAQFSEYQGGAYDGDVDNYLVFGASVKYLFSKNFFSEAGYNVDTLASDIPGRSFTRNRVFIGAGVTY